jgi:hypothetical protein
VSRNRHERLLLNLRILVHSPEIDLSYPKTCALLEELILHISSAQIFLFHCIRLTKILAIQSNSASMEPRSDKTEQSYIALPHKEHCGGGEDTELDASTLLPKQRSPTTIKIFSIIASAVAMSALALIFIATAASLPRQSEIPNYGSSRSEALSLGCRFDPMSFCWLPEDCYDAELTEDFFSAREWEWFRDANGTVPIPYEEAVAGVYDRLFVPWEYHKLHCAYMWKKLHRAVRSGGPMDSYIGNYTHTKHYSHALLKVTPESEQSNLIIASQFHFCLKRGTSSDWVWPEDKCPWGKGNCKSRTEP